MAGWGQDAPAETGSALSVALSKLRHGLGADHLQGRTSIELLLPQATYEEVQKLPWLMPAFATEDGKLKLSIHSLIGLSSE